MCTITGHNLRFFECRQLILRSGCRGGAVQPGAWSPGNRQRFYGLRLGRVAQRDDRAILGGGIRVTHEYGDPFNDQAIAAAVERTIALRNAAPEVALDAHVDQAVHEHICACAVDIEDSIEHARSGLHETLAREVRRRVDRRVSESDTVRSDDHVDEASRTSFPTSDAPAWIRPGPDGASGQN
jgi:hypothetical protein